MAEVLMSDLRETRRTAAPQAGKIRLVPARRKPRAANAQGVIRISDDAAAALFALAYETGLTIKAIASQIIVQALDNGLIELVEHAEEGAEG